MKEVKSKKYGQAAEYVFDYTAYIVEVEGRALEYYGVDEIHITRFRFPAGVAPAAGVECLVYITGDAAIAGGWSVTRIRENQLPYLS